MFVKFGLQYFLKRPAVGLFTYGFIDSVSCIVQIFGLSRWIVLEGEQEAVKILGKIHAISFWRRRL